MTVPNPSEPSLIAPLQADALTHEIERQLQDERNALIAAAQDEARGAIADARANARKRLHQAIGELRREGERRLTRAKAELETAARARQQQQASHALKAAWPLLRDALAARWHDSAARKLWTDSVAELCARRLRRGDWTVEHPADWTAQEQTGFAAAFADSGNIKLTFAAAPDLTAGLRIKADQAVLDASVAGLTHDGRAIAAMLLDELAHGTPHE
jgi:F0F1-type ATP synthase membrane subunit b/b'